MPLWIDNETIYKNTGIQLTSSKTGLLKQEAENKTLPGELINHVFIHLVLLFAITSVHVQVSHTSQLVLHRRSEDQKPENAVETARIEASSGLMRQYTQKLKRIKQMQWYPLPGLSSMVVFSCPSVAFLSTHLFCLRSGSCNSFKGSGLPANLWNAL